MIHQDFEPDQRDNAGFSGSGKVPRFDFDAIRWRSSLAAITFALFGVLPARVQAGNDNRALYAAATDYRVAVLRFEALVRAVRGIERRDERLVDEFEEATKELRLASRNPRHSSRLRNEWREIQPLQLRVEGVIFGKYTYNHDLFRAWDKVLFMQDRFYEEYLFTLDNPRHGNSVERRISRSRPQRYVPPPPASRGRIYSIPSLAPR